MSVEFDTWHRYGKALRSTWTLDGSSESAIALLEKVAASPPTGPAYLDVQLRSIQCPFLSIVRGSTLNIENVSVELHCELAFSSVYSSAQRSSGATQMLCGSTFFLRPGDASKIRICVSSELGRVTFRSRSSIILNEAVGATPSAVMPPLRETHAGTFTRDAATVPILSKRDGPTMYL